MLQGEAPQEAQCGDLLLPARSICDKMSLSRNPGDRNIGLQPTYRPVRPDSGRIYGNLKLDGCQWSHLISISGEEGLTRREEYFTYCRVNPSRHGGTHCDAVHDQVVVRKLDTLHLSSCSRGEANGADHVLAVSPLKAMG